jgi:hypothetical protein
MSSTAEKVLAKSFSSPDEVRTFEKGKVEIVNLGRPIEDKFLVALTFLKK